MTIEDLLQYDGRLVVADVGAAAIAEEPIYGKLFKRGLVDLHLFDGDSRQQDGVRSAFGKSSCTHYSNFIFDGRAHDVYQCSPASGMTSLLKPDPIALGFFNEFSRFGEVLGSIPVNTYRLDDIVSLPKVDFIKIDAQGSELTIIKNGTQKLSDCLAAQLEVSFLSLYQNQPSFGDIDVHMRSLGFVPHSFIDVKRWSIFPTIFNGNYRNPGNQLLEADILYIRDPRYLERLSTYQVKRLALIAHYFSHSFDLVIHIIRHLENREIVEENLHLVYMSSTPKE